MRNLEGSDLARQRVEREVNIGQQSATVSFHRSGVESTHRLASDEDLYLMRLIDILRLEYPSKGTRKLANIRADLGFASGRAIVQFLMDAIRI
jgi:hypothetical protein